MRELQRARQAQEHRIRVPGGSTWLATHISEFFHNINSLEATFETSMLQKVHGHYISAS